ncbi:hypothetical protein MHK_003995, partial [Candidatus Magnetomorum sp. HK-1]
SVYFTEIRGSWILDKNPSHPDDNNSITNWGGINNNLDTECKGIIAFGTSENVIKAGEDWGVSGLNDSDDEYQFDTFVNKTRIIRFENHQKCADKGKEAMKVKSLEILVR